MSKTKANQVAIATLVVLIVLSAQLVARNFSHWQIVEQMTGVSLVMGLIGFFFGLWLQRPVRIVFRDCGRRGTKKIGLFTPWLGIFFLLVSPLL